MMPFIRSERHGRPRDVHRIQDLARWYRLRGHEVLAQAGHLYWKLDPASVARAAWLERRGHALLAESAAYAKCAERLGVEV